MKNFFYIFFVTILLYPTLLFPVTVINKTNYKLLIKVTEFLNAKNSQTNPVEIKPGKEFENDEAISLEITFNELPYYFDDLNNNITIILSEIYESSLAAEFQSKQN